MFMLVYYIECRSKTYTSSVVIISMSVFSICCPSLLLYGSEVWGIFAIDKLQKQKDLYLNKLCTDFTAEKIHTKLW
jgi:hypothetical protein